MSRSGIHVIKGISSFIYFSGPSVSPHWAMKLFSFCQPYFKNRDEPLLTSSFFWQYGTDSLFYHYSYSACHGVHILRRIFGIWKYPCIWSKILGSSVDPATCPMHHLNFEFFDVNKRMITPTSPGCFGYCIKWCIWTSCVLRYRDLQMSLNTCLTVKCFVHHI